MRSDDITRALDVGQKWTRQVKTEEKRPSARTYRQSMWTVSRVSLRDICEEHMSAAWDKASDGGRLPTHWRQVFYVMRPICDDHPESDRPLRDTTFKNILEQYLEEHTATTRRPVRRAHSRARNSRRSCSSPRVVGGSCSSCSPGPACGSVRRSRCAGGTCSSTGPAPSCACVERTCAASTGRQRVSTADATSRLRSTPSGLYGSAEPRASGRATAISCSRR